MSKTVFTLPWNFTAPDAGLVAWVKDQGIDPARVVVDEFRIDEDEAGVLTFHYIEFDLNEERKRIIARSPGGDYSDSTGYMKSPRSQTVTSLPILQTAVR